MAEVETVVLAPDGDAILVVQDGCNGPTKKFRVCTWRLRASSAAFKAMFGPYFAEGQNLNAQNPPEIDLEDDAVSMDIICHALHHQNSRIPQSLSAQQVLKWAQTVNKYGLTEAMLWVTQSWLVPCSDIDDLHVLLEASIILKHSPSFEKLTRALIFDSKEPLTDVRKADFEHGLALVRVAMEQKRTILQTGINELIFQEAVSIAGGCQCKWARSYAYNFLEQVRSARLSPACVAEMSITEAIDKIENMNDARMPHQDDAPSCSQERWHRSPETTRKNLKARLELLKEFKDLQIGMYNDISPSRSNSDDKF